MTRTSRRSLLKSTWLGAAGAGAAFARQPERPNILLVLSDDHTAEHLGCYGDKVVQTPNLDQFASESMRFDRAYTTAPQCSPSRASMMTGQSPQRVHMTRLHAPLPREHKTYYEYLREAGYYTGLTGRSHHMEGLGGERGQWARDIHARHGQQTMKHRVDFIHSGNQEDGLVQFGVFLDRKPKDKPFACQVCFSDPHQPWTAAEFEKRYNPADVRVPEYMPDAPEIREMFVKYYAEVSHADYLFGQVMDALGKRGLRENTMVLFMGDNGASMPFAKGTLYQAGWHVPLLVRWPGHVKPGTATGELVSGADFLATFLEAAGVPVPVHTESHSFLNVLEGRPHQGRKFVFASRGWHDRLDLARAVCSRAHSLIFNAWPEYGPPRLPEGYDPEREVDAGRLNPKAAAKWTRTSRPLYEMFDLRNDPYELENLVGRPEHRETEFALKSALSEWMEASHDFLPPPFLRSRELDADPLRGK